jgi:hypothetical protein
MRNAFHVAKNIVAFQCLPTVTATRWRHGGDKIRIASDPLAIFVADLHMTVLTPLISGAAVNRNKNYADETGAIAPVAIRR